MLTEPALSSAPARPRARGITLRHPRGLRLCARISQQGRGKPGVPVDSRRDWHWQLQAGPAIHGARAPPRPAPRSYGRSDSESHLTRHQPTVTVAGRGGGGPAAASSTHGDSPGGWHTVTGRATFGARATVFVQCCQWHDAASSRAFKLAQRADRLITGSTRLGIAEPTGP